MPSEEVRRLLKLFGVAVTEFEDGKSQTHIAILRKRKQIRDDTRIFSPVTVAGLCDTIGRYV